MNQHQLRELIAAVKAGRVSRRTFVRQMVGLGLTATLANQLLANASLAQMAGSSDYKPNKPVLQVIDPAMKGNLLWRSTNSESTRCMLARWQSW
jgi:hypothetical protein